VTSEHLFRLGLHNERRELGAHFGLVLLRCLPIGGQSTKNLALLRIGNGIQVQDQLGEQVVFGIEAGGRYFEHLRQSLDGSVVRLMLSALVLVDS
jgi:hypothetical protein